MTRALVYTPLYALLALFIFLRDVYLCYTALYAIAAILVLWI